MKDVFEQVTGVSEAWKGFTVNFHAVVESVESEYDYSTLIPNSEFSVTSIEFDLEILRTLISNIDAQAFVPATVRSQLLTDVQQLKALVEKAEAKVSASGAINLANLTIQTQQGQQNLGEDLRQTGAKLTEIFQRHFGWLLIQQKGKGAESLKIFQEFRDQYTQLKNIKAGISRAETQSQKSLETITKNQTSIAETLQGAQQDLELIAKQKKSAETKLSEIGTSQAEVQQTVNEIDGILTNAKTLKNEVTNYKTEFDQFKVQLAQRNNKLDTLHVESQLLLDAGKKFVEEIQQIKADANEMLSGATTAGLAKEFADYRDELANQLTWAGYFFYFSIGLLFIFSLPLILMVVPPLRLLIERFLDLPVNSLTSPSQALIYDSKNITTELRMILDASARLLIIMPFIWLTTFSARRYSRFFRLKEHYAYKRSIAASVDGFKKQAKSYEDEIAAAAFHELIFNPAERMDAKQTRDDGPNPILKWLLNKIEERVGAFQNSEK